MDRIIRRKAESVHRCIKRVYQEVEFDVYNDFSHQDALLMNLQRACQLVIDIGTHVIKIKKLGVPHESTEVFQILYDQGIIDLDILNTMKGMVGFRNIVVHDYTSINMDIVMRVVNHHLGDLIKFCHTALNIED